MYNKWLYIITLSTFLCFRRTCLYSPESNYWHLSTMSMPFFMMCNSYNKNSLFENANHYIIFVDMTMLGICTLSTNSFSNIYFSKRMQMKRKEIENCKMVKWKCSLHQCIVRIKLKPNLIFFTFSKTFIEKENQWHHTMTRVEKISITFVANFFIPVKNNSLNVYMSYVCVILRLKCH